MPSRFEPHSRQTTGLSRRHCLGIGGLGGTFGLSLPGLWSAREASAGVVHDPGAGRAKSCILLFLLGGPPQHETWDPKPDAPVEIRGDLKPIASRTPGLSVGELMPKTAALTDKICVLRAMSTRDNAHSSSGYWMLTGMPHTPMNVENANPGAPNDWPSVGAAVQRLRASASSLPGAIRLPEHIWNTNGSVWPGQDAGFLGTTADPWLLMCDPNEPNFAVPGVALGPELPRDRAAAREALLTALNRPEVRALQAGSSASTSTRWDDLTHRAFDLIAARRGGAAFDLEQEPAALRDRYGRNRFGQSVLLARRLVESGVSLVQVNWMRWKDDSQDSPAWDTHARNADRLKTALMPPMDMAYSTLLEDLADRGLLDETLVVWMGEFGRTPKINARGGRDHWGNVFSVALAGGGVRGGQMLGASDDIGGHPKEGKVDPSDLAATIFHALGISPESIVHDRLGRPLPISRGHVIPGMFG